MNILQSKNFLDLIKLTKEENQKKYLSCIAVYKRRAEEGENSLKELGFEYRITPYPSGIEKRKAYTYCQALAAYGYKSHYMGKDVAEFNIDLEKLLAVCEKIDRDPRVVIVDKQALLYYIDLFFEARVTLKILNRCVPGKFNRHKEGNTPFFGLHYMFSRLANEAPRVKPDKNSKKFITEEDLKISEKILKENVFVPQAEALGMTQVEYARLLKKFLPLEQKKLQKNLLSNLYSAIITVRDVAISPDTNFTTSKASAIKADLLFDFLPILFPNRRFLTAREVKDRHEKFDGFRKRGQGFYEGSYFRYRKDKVLSIIGKVDIMGSNI